MGGMGLVHLRTTPSVQPPACAAASTCAYSSSLTLKAIDFVQRARLNHEAEPSRSSLSAARAQHPFGGDVSPLHPVRSTARFDLARSHPGSAFRPRSSWRNGHASGQPIGGRIGIGNGGYSDRDQGTDRRLIAPAIENTSDGPQRREDRRTIYFGGIAYSV
jgi:hypothetical protein